MTRSLAWCAAALVVAFQPSAAQCPDGSQAPCRARPVTPAMSVAVMTFQSRSRDTNDVFLAEGLADDIAARLGQVDRIVVRSREAVRRLPNADKMSMANLGQELSAAYILSGSVQPAGGRLRVRVELTKAQTSVVAWSNPYDRTRDDILAMQSEIASQVASAVAGRLGVADARKVAASPTMNSEAFTHLARGTAFLGRRMTVYAVADLRAAVRLDPAFSVAWARLSQALSLCANARCGADSQTVVRRQARAAADRAIALDSNLADAWLADGLALVNSDRPDVPAARASLERAVRLDPRNAEAQHVLAYQMLRLGDNAAAKIAYRKALAIDPGRGITWTHLAFVSFDEGRFADQEAFADTALALLPSLGDARSYKWSAVMHLNDPSRMRGLIRRLGDSTTGGELYEEVFVRLAERDTAGASATMDKILALPGFPGLFAAALLARLGRREEAAAQVRGWPEPTIGNWRSLRSPAYDALRGMRDFEAYVERARQRVFWTARPK